MGMFDEITCHYPLKKCPAELLGVKGKWQTKDLGCGLEDYTLTAEGRLTKQETEYLLADNFGATPFGLSWQAFGTKEVDINYHGMLNMYTHTKSTGRWIEYRLKFTDGQLVEATKLDSR